jgi:hypothetical protein
MLVRAPARRRSTSLCAGIWLRQLKLVELSTRFALSQSVIRETLARLTVLLASHHVLGEHTRGVG